MAGQTGLGSTRVIRQPCRPNFRSRPAILTYINRCFAAPLSGAGQPGYVALAATIDPPDHELPCAAKISIDLPPNAKRAAVTDHFEESINTGGQSPGDLAISLGFQQSPAALEFYKTSRAQ